MHLVFNNGSSFEILRRIHVKRLFSFRFSKKPSMSRNIRLCMHNCANSSLKKLQISNHKTQLRALSRSCCSKSVEMSLKIAPKSHNSTKKWPPFPAALIRMKRTPNIWPNEKCSAISSSWVNWANLRLYKIPSSIVAVNNSW